jgi:ABC-type spermidine/putrescine transport system permease subunit II
MNSISGKDSKRKRSFFTAEDNIWLAVGLYSSLLLVIGLPILMILLWSFSDAWFPPNLLPQKWTLNHWVNILNDTTLISAVGRSLAIAIIVTFLSAIISFPTAWALARFPFRMKRFVELFILLPLIVPGIVVAVSLGKVFLELGLSYTISGVILAQLIGTLPMMIRLLTAALEGIPEDLLLAARSLGASSFRAMWNIAVPLSIPGLVAGGLLSFVSSFEEFERTFVVGAPQIETLPVKLYYYLEGQGVVLPTAAVVSFILLVPVLIVFILAGRIMRDDVMSSGMGKT